MVASQVQVIFDKNYMKMLVFLKKHFSTFDSFLKNNISFKIFRRNSYFLVKNGRSHVKNYHFQVKRDVYRQSFLIEMALSIPILISVYTVTVKRTLGIKTFLNMSYSFRTSNLVFFVQIEIRFLSKISIFEIELFVNKYRPKYYFSHGFISMD